MQPLRASNSSRAAAQLLALMTQVSQGSEPRAMALAAELELSLSQLRALIVLWRADGPPPLHELAAEVGLSDAAAVRMVDGLLRLDLVSRREDAVDRRVKRIALTDTGREAVGRLVAAKREGLERLVERFEPEEVDRLVEALDPILERLGLPLEAEPTVHAHVPPQTS